MHGKDDHAQAGVAVAEVLECLQPVHAGHAHVEQDDVGVGLFEELKQRCTAVGLADDVDLLAFEHPAQAVTHDAVVVGEDDPHPRSSSYPVAAGTHARSRVPCPLSV